jgi:superfamily I DNA and/or RNA helicase
MIDCFRFCFNFAFKFKLRRYSEAEAVMNVLSQLLSAGDLQPHMIGIVTPYAAQVRSLRRMIRQRGRAVQVDSIKTP